MSNEIQKSDQIEVAAGERVQWQRPTFRVLDAAEAESGALVGPDVYAYS